MNTKTKLVWSSFRPDHFENVLSIRTCMLSDFYSDQLHLLAAIENQFCLLLVFHFFPYIHNLPRRSPLPQIIIKSLYVLQPYFTYFSLLRKMYSTYFCILPLTLFFSAAPCFYVSQEGLILYSCVLLARSLTCANY